MRTLALAPLVVVLWAASTAAAAPSVTFSLRALPIPKNLLKPKGSTWPHTGDMAGAGTELEANFTITGSEDHGLPNPLRRVVIYLPKGLQAHTSGFGTCKPPHSNWYKTGEHPPCPSNSYAGVVTEQHTEVDFGSSHLAYPINHGAFFTPGGGLRFWEVGVGGWLSALGEDRASFRSLRGAFSYSLTENLPHREVMGRGSGSELLTDAITVALGAAYRHGGRLTSYITMPSVCPSGGLPVKAMLSFGRGEPAASWETVTTTAKLRCGSRKARG
jgi:hypothetical protein